MAPAAAAAAARRDRAGVAAAPRRRLGRAEGGGGCCCWASVEAARESAPKGDRISPPTSLSTSRLRYCELWWCEKVGRCQGHGSAGWLA
jgi:hypothetical protein